MVHAEAGVVCRYKERAVTSCGKYRKVGLNYGKTMECGDEELKVSFTSNK